MAAGMVSISNNGGESSCRYIMRSGECELYFSNIEGDKKEILRQVSEMAKIEKRGSKELGIRGRHDARAMKKLIITLPNSNTTDQNKQLLSLLLFKTSIADYPHVAAIHKGVKDGIENKHAHVNFFERRFEEGNSNKNRDFNLKSFANDFRSTYQKVFGLQPGTAPRERLGRQQFEKRREDEKILVGVEKELADTKKELTEVIKTIKNVRFRRELANGGTVSPGAKRDKNDSGRVASPGLSRGKGIAARDIKKPQIDGKPPYDPLGDLSETIRKDERAAAASKTPAGKQNTPANQQRPPNQDRSTDLGLSR